MTNENVKVSVIMLTYNQENYVAQALDSVLMQKVDFPYEILIGDDCSTDSTCEQLQRYAEQYPDIIRLFPRSENLGPTRNAYELLCAAQGEYLAFCEGDDFWLDEDKLAVQTTFLDEHPLFIGCSCRCLLVDEHGQPLPKQKLSWVKYKNRFTLKDFSGGRYLPGQTASIVKRNIFIGAGREYAVMYEADRFISDRTSTAVYLTQGDFCCLPRCMSAYRKITKKGGENLTSKLYKSNDDKCRHELELTKHIEDYVTETTGKPTRFQLKRCDILTDAVIGLLRSPNAARLRILRETAKAAPWYGWLYIPYALAKKIMLR